ncbi:MULTISPECIES: DUF4124 domain-containing protein [Methylobacillus]|uniref:DUF4124 domain-containing protein n=1 Tax=Methylobacillus flagellatus (strain ATCC 51484 / DSM 6875 / VKM B-1610 / KT) TaxID=265072 RepID=Q1H277_METFK|nr:MULTISPECIES: DUF4124 domain-containing protein [Methylobacillus]ABE49410.1 hypothetical protein Mfla_1142 [Methylobacillus flagellatus KT]MPS48022.1 DUF4124 domain-containing protein [Methylobacillus sp.]
MNNVRWLAFVMMVILPWMTQAQVYKWKDNNGVTLYSDSPPPGNVPYELVDNVKSTPGTATAPVAGADSQAVRNAAALRRQAEAEQERRNEEKKRSEEEARRVNCQNAKANYQNFKIGGRIYKMTPEGEREYLGDEDIQRGLEEAAKEVKQYCTDEG